MSSFKDLGISSKLIKGLKELNIIEPTEIQSEVIPILLEGPIDLVGQAQTGTGKTAAYGLPLIHRIDPREDVIQGLVLCPTRELGQQVAKQLFKFTKYTEKIFTEAVYGGAPIDRQISALRRTTHIVVATPGRLLDLLERKALDLSHVKTVVLDEADEMLSMGFKKDLDQILKSLASAQCKWLFSATMPAGIHKIVNEHLRENAHRIEVAGHNTLNKNIKHQYLLCDESEKLYWLQKLIKDDADKRGIVFCKTKAATQKLAKQLQAKNISADAIHGDLLQKERDKVMRAFKNESLQILVATDLAARGLDVEDLAYVVHYQLPDQDEYFTHRSGRTARAGKEGISLCLLSSNEMKQIQHFEKVFGIFFLQVTTV